jgi:hypothetical protein
LLLLLLLRLQLPCWLWGRAPWHQAGAAAAAAWRVQVISALLLATGTCLHSQRQLAAAAAEGACLQASPSLLRCCPLLLQLLVTQTAQAPACNK